MYKNPIKFKAELKPVNKDKSQAKTAINTELRELDIKSDDTFIYESYSHI